MDNEEMLRCLDVVADYMEKVDESPICAMDIRKIKTALINAWAIIERDDTILEFLLGICEEAEEYNNGRIGAAWLRTFCEHKISIKDKENDH